MLAFLRYIFNLTNCLIHKNLYEALKVLDRCQPSLNIIDFVNLVNFLVPVKFMKNIKSTGSLSGEYLFHTRIIDLFTDARY